MNGSLFGKSRVHIVGRGMVDSLEVDEAARYLAEQVALQITALYDDPPARFIADTEQDVYDALCDCLVGLELDTLEARTAEAMVSADEDRLRDRGMNGR